MPLAPGYLLNNVTTSVGGQSQVYRAGTLVTNAAILAAIEDAGGKTGNPADPIIAAAAAVAAKLRTKGNADDAAIQSVMFASGIASGAASGSGDIRSDGTVPFAGNESMGGFKLTNLGAPTAPGDAVTKAYSDAQAGGEVPNGRQVIAGAGLTGGGDLTADRTFDVVANADGSILANANDVQVGVLATDAQHGLRGGGTQHAVVVAAGAAGFMTGADKTKIDGLPASAAPTTRNLTAGAGLTGGGDLSADRTFDVVANADGSIVANANDVQVGVLATDAQHGLRGGGTQHADVVAAGASGFMTGADKTKLDGIPASAVPTTRTLTAGAGLTGGGDLSADRTFDVVANADGSIAVNANDVQVGVLATDAQHGNRGGGAVHANAVAAGAAGFMTGADKTKLDGLPTNGAAFTTGSVPFMAAGGALAQDNANLFFDDTNNRLGVGANAFTTVQEKIRMGKPAGNEAYARLDGALAAGVTDASAFPGLNSASQFLCFVVGSQLDMDQFGFGNAGLYACARTGPTPGSPPTLAPFIGLSCSDNGTLVPLGSPGGGRSVYVGGGGWGAPAANDFTVFTAPTYTETADTDVLRFHINNAGEVAVGLGGASGTGKFQISGADIAGVAFRCTVTSPSRFINALSVGADANPTSGFFFEQSGAGGSRFARAVATSGAASNFLYVGAAHTGQTAGTETPDVDFDGSATLQHATGALATQRQQIIRARTYSFVGASTITDAATLAVTAAPTAGTNATITNSYALWVQAGKARFQGAVVEDAVISPTALSGTSNDYSPTGLAATRTVRQDCSAASVLTGLLALQGGQRITVINLATNVLFTLTLNNEDAGSTAANRFTLPAGAALVIPAGGAVELWYDTTSSRWRPTSSV